VAAYVLDSMNDKQFVAGSGAITATSILFMYLSFILHTMYFGRMEEV